MMYDIFVNCNWVVTPWLKYSTHIHKHNTYNDTKQTIHRTTQQLEECRPCLVLASYTLAFALEPRKKHGKTHKPIQTYIIKISCARRSNFSRLVVYS